MIIELNSHSRRIIMKLSLKFTIILKLIWSIYSRESNDGEYSYNVPFSLEDGDDYRISIEVEDEYYYSDYFSIEKEKDEEVISGYELIPIIGGLFVGIIIVSMRRKISTKTKI